MDGQVGAISCAQRYGRVDLSLIVSIRVEGCAHRYVVTMTVATMPGW